MDTTSFTLEDFNRQNAFRNSQGNLNHLGNSNYDSGGKTRSNFPPARLTAVPPIFSEPMANSGAALRPPAWAAAASTLLRLADCVLNQSYLVIKQMNSYYGLFHWNILIENELIAIKRMSDISYRMWINITFTWALSNVMIPCPLM